MMIMLVLKGMKLFFAQHLSLSVALQCYHVLRAGTKASERAIKGHLQLHEPTTNSNYGTIQRVQSHFYYRLRLLEQECF